MSDLPNWVKWLPPEAAAAIDPYWKPLWDQLRLLPEPQARPGELDREAVAEPRPGDAWRERFEDAFLEPPLHGTAHERGFGTIYTAAYEPAAGRVRYRWPELVWEQSFDRFEPGSRTVTLS